MFNMEFLDHQTLKNRLCKTFYYGEIPSTDRPSFPLSEVVVEFVRSAAPRDLGRLDHYTVSSIGREACVSPCSLMIGMIYIERLRHRNPSYLLQVSSSDLFLVSVMIASKYLYDEGIDEEVYNDEWAESASIDLNDLNELEFDFLKAIDWKLYVSLEQFQGVLQDFERRVSRLQSARVGVTTYGDLFVLCHNQLCGCLLKMCADAVYAIAVVSIAYLAASATLVSSMISLVSIQTQVALLAKQLPTEIIAPMSVISSGNDPLSELDEENEERILERLTKGLHQEEVSKWAPSNFSAGTAAYDNSNKSGILNFNLNPTIQIKRISWKEITGIRQWHWSTNSQPLKPHNYICG